MQRGWKFNKKKMSNIYIFLDARTTKKDGSHPLRMAVTHNHKSAYESLTTFVRKDEWDKEAQCVIKRPDKKFLNVMLRKRLADAETCFDRISTRPDFDKLEAAEILRMCMRGSSTVDTPKEMDYVLPIFNERIEIITKAKTRAQYKTVRNNIIEYMGPDIDTLRFKDITGIWMMKYHKWLLETKGMSINGANSYLRTFRALFNFARNRLMTLANVPLNNMDLSDLVMALSNKSPFQEIDMGAIESKRFDMPFADFIRWVICPAKEWCEKYRDIFILSFYLWGIRPVDVLELTWSNVHEGRIIYYPKKLGGKVRISVKIEPEAWELIEKYKGKEHLLEFLDTRSDYAQFCKQWNKGLKSIREIIPVEKNGKVEMREVSPVPYITAYYARYNWGTYCYNYADVPMDIIAQGYGHKSGMRVTNIYVRRCEEKVDEANRRLIDYFKKAVEKAKKNPHDLLRQQG